jgi:hypothetical protein
MVVTSTTTTNEVDGPSMDSRYVMFLPVGDWEFAGAEQRRTEAMRQWMCARAEEEYIAAVECVRAEGLNHTAAWRLFTRAHRIRSARYNIESNPYDRGRGIFLFVRPTPTNWCIASV